MLLVARRNHEAHDGHVEPKDGDEVEEEPPQAYANVAQAGDRQAHGNA